jgi:hypothetical protein
MAEPLSGPLAWFKTDRCKIRFACLGTAVWGKRPSVLKSITENDIREQLLY